MQSCLRKEGTQMKENSRVISMLLCLCTALMLLACVPSHAAAAGRVLIIPASMQEIEMEAFYKDTSIETVELPDGIRYIGQRAFALSSIKAINLLGSLEEIADDAFAGCSGLTASVTSGSYAMQWCIDHDIDYKAKMEWPESAHPYADEFDYTWTYTEPGNVEYLTLVFSRETKTESGCDFITLLDANGKQIGRYSGSQLSGKQIKVMGNTFSIRLTSDATLEGANDNYGFKLEDIQVEYVKALSVTSVTAQSTAVAGGETICWKRYKSMHLMSVGAYIQLNCRMAWLP